MITVITPTRDRPQAFALCEKYMARQTYTGPKQWIVVDDGDVPIKTTMGQTYIRRSPSVSSNTLPQNLLEAIKHYDPKSDAILFMEDDEWYSARYIERMLPYTKSHEIVGVGLHRYYNVFSRRFKLHTNTQYAGLCCTAISPSLLGWLTKACHGAIEEKDPWVDLRLWCASPIYPHRELKKHVFPNNGLIVGIKRMPGRDGLGSGHGINDPADFMTHFDKDGELLRVWIGDDAQEYLQYGAPGLPREFKKKKPLTHTASVVFTGNLNGLKQCIQSIFTHAQKVADQTQIIVTDNRGEMEALPYLISMEAPIYGLPVLINIHNAEALKTEECHANAMQMARGSKFLAVRDDLVVTPGVLSEFFA